MIPGRVHGPWNRIEVAEGCGGWTLVAEELLSAQGIAKGIYDTVWDVYLEHPSGERLPRKVKLVKGEDLMSRMLSLRSGMSG